MSGQDTARRCSAPVYALRVDYSQAGSSTAAAVMFCLCRAGLYCLLLDARQRGR